MFDVADFNQHRRHGQRDDRRRFSGHHKLRNADLRIGPFLLGAALVYILFPKHESEKRLLASYQADDTAGYASTSPERLPVGAAEPGGVA